MVELPIACTLTQAEIADGFRLQLGSDVVTPEALGIFVEMLFPSAVVEIVP